MLARFVLGAVTAGAVIAPALAGQIMNAEEAKKFVAGKVFAFTCFDGTRGAGRVFEDGGAAGAVQFSGSGPVRHLRLPGNTIQVRGEAVCASIKGIPFEPCFNLDKKDERNFRGSVSGMGFAYCDFSHQGAASMMMARAVARPRSARVSEEDRSSDASHTEVASRVETPKVEKIRIDPVKSEAKAETKAEIKAEAKSEAKSELKSEAKSEANSESAKSESSLELRRSTE